MNEYRISFQSPDGESGTRTIIERTESSARKAFRAVYKASGDAAPDIFNIELVRTDACATKQQEMDTLEAIQKMVIELGPQSYVATAFEGCFEIAAQNIDYDFGGSMKGRAESAEQEVARLKAELKKAQQGIEELIQKDDERKSSLERMSSQVLSYGDLDALRQLASDRANEADEVAEKAAAEIVKYAEDPASKEFENAVSKHRSYVKVAERCRGLLGRVEDVQAAIRSRS